jgi:hypothetical protein
MATREPLFEDLPNVPLSRLHLNPQNPRHKPIEDEADIIAELYRREKVLELLQEIATRGLLSPIERIGVVDLPEVPGHYLVVEGNRRVCALKLLADARKAPTAAARKTLDALAEQMKAPRALSVVKFRDMEAADPWIDLRHLGEQDGRGTRKWNSAQKARRAGGAAANSLALQVLDRASAGGWISTTEREAIAITTLTRYLSNPVVRDALGLGDPKRLEFTYEPAEVDAALKTFVRDGLRATDESDPHALSSRSRKSDRETYGRSLRTRDVSPKTPLDAPIEPPPVSRSAAPADKKLRHRSNADRRRLLEGAALSTKDKVVRNLVDELRVDTSGHEFTVNYLLRALIERSLILYAKRQHCWSPGISDKALLQNCIKALQASGVTDAELKNMRTTFSDENVSFGLHTLGHAVHTGVAPARRDLNRAWDNWEPMVRVMLRGAEAP